MECLTEFLVRLRRGIGQTVLGVFGDERLPVQISHLVAVHRVVLQGPVGIVVVFSVRVLRRVAEKDRFDSLFLADVKMESRNVVEIVVERHILGRVPRFLWNIDETHVLSADEQIIIGERRQAKDKKSKHQKNLLHFFLPK